MTDAELWEAYHADRNQCARNALVIRYLRLVRIAADPILRTLPSHVDYEDLRVAGVFGLMDAITKFDLTVGAKFETYAVNRIRGAVIDELRAQDWVPRNVRTRAKRYESTVAKLEADLGRSPADREVAEAMDVGCGELQAIMRERRTLTTLSLDAFEIDMHGGRNSTATQGKELFGLLPDRSAGVEEQAAIGDFREHLAHHIAGLSEKSRLVISLAYVECMTLAQMGVVLGVSESRVSQLQSAALREIQELLDGAHV